MDSAIAGSCRIGYFRIGVYHPNFDNEILSGMYSGYVTDLTLHKLMLADTRDATTGWYDCSYTDSTINGLIVSKDARQLQLQLGTVVTSDAMLRTCDVVKEGDRVEDEGEKLFEVTAVVEQMNADDFLFRDCNLTEVRFY